VLAALPACGRLETRERTLNLTDQLRVYGKLVRWGEFDAARAYIRLRPGSEAKDPNPPELYGGIKVTHYVLRESVFNEGQTEAATTHQIRYFHVDTRREVEGFDRQIWYWDEESAQWLLDGTLPDFTGAH
jgi:hypothetical protein